MTTNAGERTPQLLSVGVSSGGLSPANRWIHDSLAELMRTVSRERADYPNRGLKVNVVFHVPGPMFQPDYEGVHATRLDRRNHHLLVVAAVPSDLTPDKFTGYLVDVLEEARREAIAYVARRKLDISTDGLSALVDHVVTQLHTARR